MKVSDGETAHSRNIREVKKSNMNCQANNLKIKDYLSKSKNKAKWIEDIHYAMGEDSYPTIKSKK